MAGLTANPKYNQSPIANKYREGKLKSTHNRGLKDLKSNSYSWLLALGLVTYVWKNGPGSLSIWRG